MKKNKSQNKNNTLLWIGIAGIVVVIGIFILAMQTLKTSEPRTSTITNGEAQEIRMTVSTNGYEPNSFTVQAGKPVRWMIQGGNSMGCAAYLTFPTAGVNKRLQQGENVIEFTAPTKPGTYPFSCSMNMYKGSITVV